MSERPIPFADGYSVTDTGDVYSTRRGRRVQLMPWRMRHGHLVVSLRSRGKTIKTLVHRLVAFLFIGPPGEGQEVRHLNGNPADNRVTNLAWGTHAENMADMVRHGRTNTRPEMRCTRPRGDRHPNRLRPETLVRGASHPSAKLTEEQAREILRRVGCGESQASLAREFGVTKTLVNRMKKNLCWKHIDREVSRA